MKIDKVRSLIEDGYTTASDITDQTGLDYTHVSRELKEMAEDGDLVREKEGRGYEYYVPAEDTDGGPSLGGKSDSTAATAIPRDYDWDDWVPEGIPDYVPTDGEYDEIMGRIEYRHEVDYTPHIRLTGPTGGGKTLLAQYVAQELDAPLFDISVKWSIDAEDLLGGFVAAGGEMKWVNGPLTKAVMASQDGPAVLLLDEINRARPESKAALYEALDDRAQVTLDALGGKTVEGEALDLIVFSTMNVGSGHVVEELDLAEQRRLGATWHINYLGVNHPEREADLLVDRAGVHDGIASALVESANEVRELADGVDHTVDRGIPTGVLIKWAKGAQVDALKGNANPVMRAARSEVMREFYEDGGRDAPGRDEVVATIESSFDGCPADAVTDPDEWSAWVGEDLDDVVGGDDPAAQSL